MLNDASPFEDCGVAIGKQLLSLWLCTGPEEIVFGVGVLAPTHQSHRLRRRNQAKAEVCGGRRGPSSPRRFPLRLRRGRPRGVQ
jgi:hypothetical protein